MPITRVVDTDSSGSPTDGTIHNNAWLQSIYDSIENAFSWQSFTPTWTGTGSNPAIVNGTLYGEYLQVGKTVWFRISVKMGSSTTYGSGVWRFAVPVPAAALTGSVTENAVGFGKLLDSGTTHRNIVVTLNSTTTFTVHAEPDTGSGLGPTVPFTWASNDELTICGCYKAA